jgi:hypothetical protein
MISALPASGARVHQRASPRVILKREEREMVLKIGYQPPKSVPFFHTVSRPD